MFYYQLAPRVNLRLILLGSIKIPVLNDFGLDSAADLENIGNSVEPLPVLRRQESDFSPARPTPLIINVPTGLCIGSYQERQEQQRLYESEGIAIYGPGSKCPGDP